MYTDEDYERLAAAVAERRAALEATQMEIAQEGGLSLDRVSAVERGEARNLRPKTIRSLERGLEWAQGSVKAVLGGDAPAAAEAATPTPEPKRKWSWGSGREAMDEAERLMDENERMIAEIREINDGVRQLDADARHMVADLVRWLKRKSEDTSRHGDQSK